MNKHKEAKLNVAHFPVGTVVELEDSIVFDRSKGDDGIRTVQSLARNGARSYVFRTGRMKEHTGEESINISHVKRIIKRGEGPLLIEDRFATHRSRIHEDLVRMSLPREERRGYWATGSLSILVSYELMKFTSHEDWFDHSRIIQDMTEQTWCRNIMLGRWIGWNIVNKKRFRRWLRQNANRYRTNLDKAEHIEDQELNSSIEEFEDFMDKHDPYRQPSEGSHYDWNDQAYTRNEITD